MNDETVDYLERALLRGIAKNQPQPDSIVFLPCRGNLPEEKGLITGTGKGQRKTLCRVPRWKNAPVVSKFKKTLRPGVSLKA